MSRLAPGVLLALVLLAAPAQAQDFQERWDERVADFRRENARLREDERTVVLFGSSTMEGWKQGRRIERFLPAGRRYLNRGISGDGIGDNPRSGLLHRMGPSALDCQPSHVFVLNGRNSIGRDGRNVERTARLFRQVVQEVKAGCPDAVVCVINDIPVNHSYTPLAPHIVRYNALLADIARDEGCPLIDLHARLVGQDGLLPRRLTSDGLHFNDEGYRILGAEIARVLAAPTAPATTPRAEDGLPGAPTTGAPTTGSPTTGSPTTGAPTTGSPTTGAPTTGAPTTPPALERSGGSWLDALLACIARWFDNLGRAFGGGRIADGTASGAASGAASRGMTDVFGGIGR